MLRQIQIKNMLNHLRSIENSPEIPTRTVSTPTSLTPDSSQPIPPELQSRSLTPDTASSSSSPSSRRGSLEVDIDSDQFILSSLTFDASPSHSRRSSCASDDSSYPDLRPSTPDSSPFFRLRKVDADALPGSRCKSVTPEDLIKSLEKLGRRNSTSSVYEEEKYPKTHSSMFSLFRREFKHGDIIYGFQVPRANYIREALGSEAMVLSTGAPTVDAQNRWIVPLTEMDAKAEMPRSVKAYHIFLSKHPKEKFRQLAERKVVTNSELRKKVCFR